MTQVDRLIIWLRQNPGSSSLEITVATRIVNVTGRISDARAEGHIIECRRVEGVARYWFVEPAQLTLGMAS